MDKALRFGLVAGLQALLLARRAVLIVKETQLPIYDSIKNLPRLGYTQIRAQILGQEGQNVAQRGATSEGTKSEKAPVNDGVCLGIIPLFAEMKMEHVFDCARTFFQGQ